MSDVSKSGALGEEQSDAFEIKKLPDSEAEITAEISAETFESYRSRVVKKLGDSVDIPGFRKGHIPENVLAQKVGEETILYDMATAAIADFYPAFVAEHTIEALGRPEITITKIARGNPLGFKIKTAVMPEFVLPDYKKIAEKEMKDAEAVFVEDAEVEKVIQDIRKNWSAVQKKDAEKTEQAAFVDTSGKPLSSAAPEGALPELDDEFVRKLGAFETVVDFKTKIKENMRLEKEMKTKEKKRMQIVDAIIKKSAFVLPAILVEGELDRMMAQFKHNLSLMGHTFEGYVAQIKKTEAEVREGWRKDAETRAKTQAILDKIAHAEHIIVPEEELRAEVKKIIAYYPDAPEDRARVYAEGILRNEKTFAFLEGALRGDSPQTPDEEKLDI